MSRRPAELNAAEQDRGRKLLCNLNLCLYCGINTWGGRTSWTLTFPRRPTAERLSRQPGNSVAPRLPAQNLPRGAEWLCLLHDRPAGRSQSMEVAQ